MIKAVIFDLNGILIKSPKLSDRFRDEFHLPPEDFLPALTAVLEKVRKPGAGDAYAYWKPYLDAWKIELSEKYFFDFWFRAEKEDPEMIALARELRKNGMKIFILSNNFAERGLYYQKHFPFLQELCEKIYYSYQTGFVKPDQGAYSFLLREHNLRPDECAYFDDSEKNVETARNLGIKSFAFEHPEHTRNLLERLISSEKTNISP